MLWVVRELTTMLVFMLNVSSQKFSPQLQVPFGLWNSGTLDQDPPLSGEVR